MHSPLLLPSPIATEFGDGKDFQPPASRSPAAPGGWLRCPPEGDSHQRFFTKAPGLLWRTVSRQWRQKDLGLSSLPGPHSQGRCSALRPADRENQGSLCSEPSPAPGLWRGVFQRNRAMCLPSSRAAVQRFHPEGEEMQWQTLFSWAPNSLRTVTAVMKVKDACSLEKQWPTKTAY